MRICRPRKAARKSHACHAERSLNAEPSGPTPRPSPKESFPPPRVVGNLKLKPLL